MEKGLFAQNIIAVVWDFDRTLTPHYMQKPLFNEFEIDEVSFWREVQQLPEYYRRAGIVVDKDTCYLGHLLSYVRAGILAGLTNAKLRELGGKIELSPGLPKFFSETKKTLEEDIFVEGDLRLEHYVVSTGLREMIRGSAVGPHVEGIWASGFIESPAKPGHDLSDVPPEAEISQIAGLLDNTTKTRALFEINKGVNKVSRITVNDSIPEMERRVPFPNMIYIADGPSDIPCFSIVRQFGGAAYGVYHPKNEDQFDQVQGLLESDRIDACGAADYREHSDTSKWIRRKIRKIAERIMRDRHEHFDSRVGREPTHILDKD